MQQLFAKPDMPVKRVYQKPAQLCALAVCGNAYATDDFCVVLGAPQAVLLLAKKFKMQKNKIVNFAVNMLYFKYN